MTDQTATEATEAPGPRCDSNRHPEHPGFTCGEVDQTRLFWDSRWAKRDAKPEPIEADACRPIEVDGETVRVRGSGELTEEGQEALAALVRVAKARFVAEAPEQVGVLQERLRRAHQALRAKEHQLDDIRRALCDAGFMEDDDPYSHADLADVIRQAVEPDQPGTVRGPIPAEYVRLKGQLESELRKMTACAAQPPKPGAEEGRAAQGGIAAGIRSSLAWAIQHFEGAAAREAFLKRLEGGR